MFGQQSGNNVFGGNQLNQLNQNQLNQNQLNQNQLNQNQLNQNQLNQLNQNQLNQNQLNQNQLNQNQLNQNQLNQNQLNQNQLNQNQLNQNQLNQNQLNQNTFSNPTTTFGGYTNFMPLQQQQQPQMNLNPGLSFGVPQNNLPGQQTDNVAALASLFNIGRPMPTLGLNQNFQNIPNLSGTVPNLGINQNIPNLGSGGINTGFNNLSNISNVQNLPRLQPIGEQINMQVKEQMNAQTLTNDLSQFNLELLKIATQNPVFFADERDEIIRKLNVLCCQYGCSYVLVGRGQSAIRVNEKNPLCKFKMITYLPRFKHKDSDGIITMDISHPIEAIKSATTEFLAFVLRIVASKTEPSPELTIDLHETIKIQDGHTRVEFCVNYKDSTGKANSISALKLLEILNDTKHRQLLAKEGIVAIDIKSDLAPELEEYYRKYPPYGINPDLWNGSFDNNPNPLLYIPYVLLGFHGVSERVQALKTQAQELMDNIRNVSTQFNDNKANYFSLNNKLSSYSSVISNLLSRVLKLYCLRERINRSGEPMIEYEEKFKIILKNLCTKIVDLQEHKKRLQRVHELMQKTQPPTITKTFNPPQTDNNAGVENCDNTTIEFLFKHLTNYNNVLTKLVQVTKKNMKTLNHISTILQHNESFQ